MRASIVIRAYNEDKYIAKLLEGIQAQKARFPYETILVDSGSTDRTRDIARNYPVQIVQISPEDFSFGFSLNRGIQHASGQYCVFISAHCYPETENWLTNLLEPLEKNDDLALVYGKQRGNHLTRFSEHQIFRKWFPDQTIESQENPFCNNANLAIRRKLWQEQKYDESLTGLEDLDWAKKILNKGYKIYYAADAGIIHVHEETADEIFHRYEREAIAFKEIFPDASFSFFKFLKLFLLNTFSDYGQAIKKRKFLSNLWDIPKFRFLQFWGTYCGYKMTGDITKELHQRFYYPRKSDSEPEKTKKESETEEHVQTKTTN